MEKIELTDKQKVLYESTKKQPFFVDVPDMNYLKFSGTGHPSQEDFQISCDALYTIAYTIKYEIARKQRSIDFKVNPMEVTWNLDKSKEKTQFEWNMMLMQPDFVTPEIVGEAIQIIEKKGKVIASDRVSFEKISFGRCIQCFHKGDYNLMNDTLDKMKAFAAQNGMACDLYTHDIYLNDMRKTKPENYKAIMRVKVR